MTSGARRCAAGRRQAAGEVVPRQLQRGTLGERARVARRQRQRPRDREVGAPVVRGVTGLADLLHVLLGQERVAVRVPRRRAHRRLAAGDARVGGHARAAPRR